MRNHTLFIAVLGICVGVIVITGFILTGSPVSQQAIRYDEARYNDFQQIKYKVEEYYRANSKLPESINQLPSRTDDEVTDPQTQKAYEYKVTSTDSYEICTEFSTTAEEFKNYGQVYSEMPIEHSKGYYCVQMKIPDYIKTQMQQSIQSVPPVQNEKPSATTETVLYQ